MREHVYAGLRLNGRAEDLLALVEDPIDCDSQDCWTCPFYHPGSKLRGADGLELSHCGYNFINQAIREVLDRAPQED